MFHLLQQYKYAQNTGIWNPHELISQTIVESTYIQNLGHDGFLELDPGCNFIRG